MGWDAEHPNRIESRGHGMNAQPKPISYGNANAIVILVGVAMGLAPGYEQDARKMLGGGAIHPMTGAAMEREALGVRERLRHDPKQIAQANEHMNRLFAEFGLA